MANIMLTILLAGICTYLIRLSFIALEGKWTSPAWVQRALRYVPAAVLSAIIFPEVFPSTASPTIVFQWPRIIAALLAVFIAWRTKKVLWAVAVGMGTLYLSQWLLGLF